MPCLFALVGAFAPRIALILIWLFTPIMSKVFDGWFFPLLGAIFLPFTTLFYVLIAADAGSINFWGWLCVGLGLLLDVQGYYTAYANRQSVPGMSTT